MDPALRQLQARHAIEDVLNRYAEAIDGGDIEALGPLLANCTLFMRNAAFLTGGDAIVDHYRRIIIFYDADSRPVEYQRGACTPRTRHVNTNFIYTFSPDATEATVRTCFTVYQNLVGENRIIAGGRYVDQFALTERGWQIRERRIHLDHAGDMTQHLHQAI